MRYRRGNFFLAFIIVIVLAISVAVPSVKDDTELLFNQGGMVNQYDQFQTDVDRAKHSFDDDGVPYLEIEGIGTERHPAWTGLYALEYLENEEMDKFWACVNWLTDNLEKQNGHYVWLYNFDNTYNDIYIKAPWYSAFGQALGIQALVAAYNESYEEKYITTAEKAAEILFVSIDESGLLYQKNGDIWFEEIPVPIENPSHILNGHMRTLLAIKQLFDVTGKSEYQIWFEKGMTTLEKWLPLYDTGYTLRYDLNPKRKELLFRFNNPFGFDLTDLAIDQISLFDPIHNQQIDLDVGSNVDSNGDKRIAGNDWGQIEELDGRSIRRLNPVTPATFDKELDGEFHSPGTYFYFNLPSEWTDNLRSEWYELVIKYKDEKPGNITIQQRAISPGPAFRDLREGDLLITGSGEWREWRIPLRNSDLGYWVGLSYAEKHSEYLTELAKYSHTLKQWDNKMKSYLTLATRFNAEKTELTTVQPLDLPRQTPMLDYYSLDSEGVLRQHQASEDNHFTSTGWDRKGDPGPPVYSPYIIAEQAFFGEIYSKSFLEPGMNMSYEELKEYYGVDPLKIKSAPAYKWITLNGKTISKDAKVWDFTFDNAYNDVVSKNPWQSAFGQNYIVKALFKAVNEGINYQDIDFKKLLKQALNAFTILIDDGGLAIRLNENSLFYEEVPNKTHVLNAHLVSTASFNKVNGLLQEVFITELFDKGINALKENLWLFDTGYWTRYDQNPKKEILFQIDQVAGEESIAIDKIYFENTATQSATIVDVGNIGDFDGVPRIAGIDWKATEVIDNTSVRRFNNGYQLRHEPLQGGSQHNVFFLAALPEQTFDDYFDVPVHRLVIRFKDTASGEYLIKAQSINQGNYLAFVPIRNGIIRTTGDDMWKEVEIIVLPQDMGWYMGVDYQVFHNEQIEELARQTKDWYFEQYAKKWEYYLKSFQENNKVIIEEKQDQKLINVSSTLKIIESSPTYPGFGIENGLDGKTDDNYVAFIEGDFPQYFSLGLEQVAQIKKIELIWESDENYATDYTIDFYDENGNLFYTESVNENLGNSHTINFDNSVESSKLVFTVNKTKGQQRILLRQIRVFVNR